MNGGDQKRLFYIAILIWAITLIVIAVIVFNAPTKRSVVPVYHSAVSNWLSQQDLYGSAFAFHYLPQFVYIYMPFYYLGIPAGDILWRALSLLALVSGVYVFIRDNFTTRQGLYFLIATLLILTPSIGALRNGQANLIFSSLCLWTAIFMMRGRWWQCSLCLGLLIAVKQTGLIVALLAVAAYPAIAWRLALVISGLLAIPLILAEPVYVLHQYKGVLKEVSGLAATNKRFADINGLLRALGFTLEGIYSLTVRAWAGGLTLIVWLYARRRLQQPFVAVIFLGFATSYLMLFHPMTEQNSYVIVAPAIALTALYMREVGIEKLTPALLMAICVSIGMLPELVRQWSPDMGLWFKPLCIAVFMALIVKEALTRRFTQRA